MTCQGHDAPGKGFSSNLLSAVFEGSRAGGGTSVP